MMIKVVVEEEEAKRPKDYEPILVSQNFANNCCSIIKRDIRMMMIKRRMK
jgi:hypothetical protein